MPPLEAVLPLHSLASGLRVAYIQQAEASGHAGIWVPKGPGAAAFTVLAIAEQVTQRRACGG
jgi:hypothetical protein